MSDDNKIIYAAVVLLSDKGKSILDKTATTGNLKELSPSLKAQIEATAFFIRKKFSVTGAGPTLSVAGRKVLFEKVFNFSVSLKTINGETYVTALSEPVIPPELKPFVKAIVFSEPAEYFG